MKTKLLAAALALATAATAAHAAVLVDNGGLTWTTQLDWTQVGQVTSVGTVQIKEVDTNDILLTVTLNSAKFVDTGAGYLFTFNLEDGAGDNSTVTVNNQPGGVQASQVTYLAPMDNDPVSTAGGNNNPDYSTSPFGHFDNAFSITAGTGGANALSSPFQFNIFNAGGITFAGLGATYDSTTGKLLTLGTGNHLFSNSDGSTTGSPTGGWWFSVDTLGSGECTDGSATATCVAAGRDAFAPVGVPEPATWTIMILGFGGIGATLRRRRTALAIA